MKDILKFGYVELKELNKTVVYVKEHKLSKEIESWSYNNINFMVTRSPFQDGRLKIRRSMSGRIDEFLLYIGVEENYFIVDNDVVKLFKDLEFFVYNKMSLIVMDIRKLETDLRFRLLEKTFLDNSEVVFEERGIIIKSPEFKLKIFVEYPEHKNNYIYSEILNCESLNVRSITHLTSLVEEFIRKNNLIVDIMSNIDKKVHKKSKNIKITKEKIDFEGKVKLSDYSYQLYELDGNMKTVDNLYSFGENEIDDMLEFITKNNLNIVKFINNEEN